MRGHGFVKLTFCLRDPPDCWMYCHWQSLFHINLGSNMLSGEIPDLMGLLFWFQSLYLLNNLLLWGHTSINFQEIYQTASKNGNGSSIKIQWIEWQYLTTNMPTSNILLDLTQYCLIMIDAGVLRIGTTMTHALVYTLCCLPQPHCSRPPSPS